MDPGNRRLNSELAKPCRNHSARMPLRCDEQTGRLIASLRAPAERWLNEFEKLNGFVSQLPTLLEFLTKLIN